MIRRFHQINALLLSLFICLHLLNHMTLLVGIELHLSTMSFLRLFYRPLLIEIPLYFLFSTQIMLGGALLAKRGWPSNRWGRAQYLSGVILALFLIQHAIAVLVTRYSVPEIDTNIYWAASVVSRDPYLWYFAPYYAAGIVAMFVHIAAACRKREKWRDYANWIVLLGIVSAGIIVPSMMGWWGNPIKLPIEYENYIENFSLSFIN